MKHSGSKLRDSKFKVLKTKVSYINRFINKAINNRRDI